MLNVVHGSAQLYFCDCQSFTRDRSVHIPPGHKLLTASLIRVCPPPAGSYIASRQFSRPPPIRFARPAPRRGSMIIAQGKTAEAAALGKSRPVPTLPFSGFAARPMAERRSPTRRPAADRSAPGRRPALQHSLGRAPNQKEGSRSSSAPDPGRRSFLAGPGLVSCRPYRTSVWLASLASLTKDERRHPGPVALDEGESRLPALAEAIC